MFSKSFIRQNNGVWFVGRENLVIDFVWGFSLENEYHVLKMEKDAVDRLKKQKK